LKILFGTILSSLTSVNVIVSQMLRWSSSSVCGLFEYKFLCLLSDKNQVDLSQEALQARICDLPVLSSNASFETLVEYSGVCVVESLA
jgi:hypothetical protein